MQNILQKGGIWPFWPANESERAASYSEKEHESVSKKKKNGREWNTGAVKNSQGMIGTTLLSGQRSIGKVNPWSVYAANWDSVKLFNVYHIWGHTHRNAIFFQGLINSAEHIVSFIRKQVKICLEGGQPFARSNTNLELCCRWGFADSALKS